MTSTHSFSGIFPIHRIGGINQNIVCACEEYKIGDISCTFPGHKKLETFSCTQLRWSTSTKKLLGTKNR